MNLKAQIELQSYGTSEGVRKEWLSRERKGLAEGPPDPHKEVGCVGPHCEKDEIKLDPKNPVIEVPHLDNLELMMTSTKGQQNIHWDKEALKTMLRMALAQLDMDDTRINYVNTPQKAKTDHYVNLKMKQKETTMFGQAAGGQTDSSSFVGRKYYVQDNPAVGYGHVISEHDNPEDAERAMLARPNSKVTSRPLPQFTPEVRDRARQRLVKTNPDVD